MKKLNMILLFILGLFVMVGCSQNIEKEIVGTWNKIDDGDHDCDTNMDEKISFDDEGKVIGIEGFKTYEIKEADNDDYDYAILSGGYENTARYRVNLDEDNHLQIVYEEEDLYDLDDVLACHMEKEADN